ncbi:hypothetical protein EDB86DRAFT_3011945 [Lactarius hatsudake]|nr:hypothetical protein EDB86DRAFT_3011945 [Lactarius hatsudake]
MCFSFSFWFHCASHRLCSTWAPPSHGSSPPLPPHHGVQDPLRPTIHPPRHLSPDVLFPCTAGTCAPSTASVLLSFFCHFSIRRVRRFARSMWLSLSEQAIHDLLLFLSRVSQSHLHLTACKPVVAAYIFRHGHLQLLPPRHSMQDPSRRRTATPSQSHTITPSQHSVQAPTMPQRSVDAQEIPPRRRLNTVCKSPSRE